MGVRFKKKKHSRFYTTLRLCYIIFCLLIQIPTSMLLHNNISLAGYTVVTVDSADIKQRRLSEVNGIADSICKFVKIATSPITKVLSAVLLFTMGAKAMFGGSISIGGMLSFVVGTFVMYNPQSVLLLFLPYSDITAGCDCKEYLVVGSQPNAAGGRDYVITPSGLRKDCSDILAP